MNFSRLKIFLVLVIIGAFSINESVAQNDSEHIKVALRMIGHQLLLNSNDSTSLVLPIERDGEKFRISFEAKFGFVPNELALSIDSIFDVTNAAKRYRVELENVDKKVIVYSYEFSPADSGIIPCKLRNQPKEKYDVLVTLLDENGNAVVGNTGGNDLGLSKSVDELSNSLLLGIIVF